MARRKGISSNATSKSRNQPEQTSAHDKPTQPNGIPHETDNKRTETMPPAQEKPRFEYTFTNNNDHKYLHKKFKKMASTGPIPEDQNSTSEQLQSNSMQGISDNVTLPPQTQIELISNRQKDNLTTALGSKESHREQANNVQINLKEICNSNDIAVSVKGLNDIGNSDEKLTRKTENYETDVPNAKETMNGGVSGRYVCPYCKLVCAKPSVLQKHIRAHTNERPYPCVPCGFAFKTKSNLYKHCRSRTHALRLQGGENGVPNNEDDWSPDSESDTSLPAAALSDTNTGSDSVSLIMTDSTRVADISSPELVSINEAVNTGSSTPQPAISTEGNKPKTIYKPKFHKASFYQDEEDRSRKLFSSNPEFLNQHISKIISDNEAIVETIDSPLQKKYSKITNLQKQIASSFENSSTTFENNKSEPLNLTKQGSSSDSEINQRKRSYSESFTQPDLQKLPQHPLNPEGSIIKDLLLKARAQACGLLPVTSENYDESEPLFVCPLCQISYRSADNLEIHRLYYCKGNNNQNNVISSTSNSKDTFKSYRPEHIYTRSNSINVTLQETYSPNSLAKLATSTLKVPLNRSHKPEQLVIVKPENNDIAAPLPSPGPLLGNTRLVDTRGTQEFNRNLYRASESNLKAKPIPSPKRRQELMRSDSFNTSPRLNEDNSQRSELYSPQTKVRCVENKPTTLRSLEELSLSPMRQNSASLQMFGGEVKILDNSGSTTTLRIEPARNNLSPTLIHERSSPSRGGGETETSSVVVRSGLHSGGTMIHTPRETTPSPHPQTPRIKVSITPNISTPNLTVTGIPAPNITHFQFPPLGVITGFNPLTLPPLSPSASINGATTILHGGKLIPHVPGMPGPNTPYVSTTMTQPKYAQSKDLLSPFSNSKEDPFCRISVAKLKGSNQQVETKNVISRPNSRSPMRQSSIQEVDKIQAEGQKHNLITVQEQKSIPIIKINNTDNTRVTTVNGMCTMSVRSKSVKNEDVKSRHNDLLQINTSRSKDSEVKKMNNTDNATSFEGDSKNRVIIVSPDPEIRRFNFENLISKSEIYNSSSIFISGENSRLSSLQEPLTISVTSFERSETSYFQKNINAKGLKEDTKSRFLRPSSLPLKPGTFTPKKHHGITPNANTMPLISPETPRPAKAYGQLYLNGHAYTYLGLKCSTKAYYCTLNRPQPTYVPNQHSLSMYSNWQICSEATPHPLGLSAGHAMALYDSRHRPQNMIVSTIKQDYILTHSSQWKNHSKEQKEIPAIQDVDKAEKHSNTDNSSSKNKELAGGFESNEAYTYVRGRGRGRYVCSECGIRCKKPSMLKKHIRTHTDVRPYTCKHCAFSFKTKGNLTKHMKSKSHYKKCCELGINPNEDMEGGELNQGSGETDEDSDSDVDDGNEGETESSDTDSWKSRLPEHEAAHCLLSLWGTRPSSTATPGLLTSARPTTYPYTPSGTEEPTVQTNTKLPVSGAKAELFGESMEVDHNEPMDLSRNEIKVNSIGEIVSPVKESTVLASLASSAAKLPQQQNHWATGEPMLHAYITERALQDSKIKQSQYTLSKLRKPENSKTNQKEITLTNDYAHTSIASSSESISESVISSQNRSREKTVNDLDVSDTDASDNAGIDTLADVAANSARLSSGIIEGQRFVISSGMSDINTSTENAKFVASEYLKMASGKSNPEKVYDKTTDKNERYEEVVKHGNIDSEEMEPRDMKEVKETETSKMHVDHEPIARKVVIGAGGVAFEVTSKNPDRFQATAALAPGRLTEDGRSVCVVCNKSFSKPSQLRLHINIHYMERPFRCGACAVSFRTRGHLQKHERSGSHHTKVSMTSAFGAATSANPRPFKCSDCKIAFRIHGHLAKHLRSKMHVMRLECLGKLPFGTFAEIERAGVSLTDIDTTDCANSLASLQLLAQKLHEKDPTKLESWDPATMVPPLLPAGRESSDEEEATPDRKPPDAPPSAEHRTFSRLDAGRHTEDSRIKYSATDT